jgi:predicted SnoaL-like aldol condensation-catalyzing enzyme
MTMKNSDVFKAYIDAFTAGDLDTARNYIADDFTFNGPMLKATNKKEFFDNISPDLLSMTRGYTMLRQFEDGDEVCSIYEYNLETPVGQGAVYMVEWNKVRDGQLTSARLLFDTAQFSALMSG